jgi:hypothetical protein
MEEERMKHDDYTNSLQYKYTKENERSVSALAAHEAVDGYWLH